jgi:exopolyphosphatase / guanosine-5'-triphosphate,3'-diphosphate pyrophosphatase
VIPPDPTPHSLEVEISRLEGAAAPAPASEFPVRLAALDVGSNAIRYSLAVFHDPEHHVELEGHRFSVRLGHDAFTTRVLSRAALDAAVAAIVRFRQRLDDLGITLYRAVATSAVRESRNGGELVERVRRESGVHLETITGSEEARLVWLAVRSRMTFRGGRWILADLGGGSLEISMVGEPGLEWSESHPLGTVRLIEDLAGVGRTPGELRKLIHATASRLALPDLAGGACEGLVATGGNAEALADLLAAPPGESGVAELRRPALGRMIERLAGLSVRERVEQLGLREDRADVILPAAILFDRLAGLAGTERILVPRVGVRDGVLLDLVSDFAEHRAHEGELDRAARAGALALGRRYRFDEAHARHVAELALSLFDQLRPLHRLDDTSRRRLLAGALLHDIGQFISYRRHHKHSWYVVSHSEVPGLSEGDQRITALLARYHRRSEPRDDHPELSSLTAEEREEVRKLASILRIADSLDREHRGVVRRVEAQLGDGTIVLHLDAAGESLLEEWALEKKSPLFEKVFGVKLQVRT